MSFIGLTPYTVRVKPKNSRKHDFLDLSKFDGKSDLSQYFFEIMKAPGIRPVSGMANRHFEPTKTLQSTRVIEGVVEVGSSGYGSKLKDIKTGAVDFNRKTAHSEFIPLYYRYNAELGAPDFSLLMLQNFEQTGLAQIVNEYFRISFRNAFPEYSLYIQRALLPNVAEALISKSPVKKVRWIRRSVPKDLADKFGAPPDYQEGEIEMIAKDKSGNPFGIKSRMKDFFSSKTSLNQLLEVGDVKYDELKLEIDIGGRKKTFSMSSIDNFRQTLDVSEDVALDSEGHPKFSSISAQAAQYEESLLKQGIL